MNISGELMRGPDLKLLQGTLDVLVLKALTFGPRHGYAVSRWIRKTTADVLEVEDGALYTALHRMETRGYVSSSWGVSPNNRKARYYRLTAQGRRQLETRTRSWTQYAGAVFKVLRSRDATTP